MLLVILIAVVVQQFICNRCSELECNAAFTTKQCLQFHYKKVHNYTQEQMPKIERSVAYTFDAYSGGMKVDFLGKAIEILFICNKYLHVIY